MANKELSASYLSGKVLDISSNSVNLSSHIPNYRTIVIEDMGIDNEHHYFDTSDHNIIHGGNDNRSPVSMTNNAAASIKLCNELRADYEDLQERYNALVRLSNIICCV